MRLKDIITAVIGLIISLSLIYITFSNIDRYIILSHLKDINMLYIPLFVISTFFEIFFRTMKWYLILLPTTKTKLWNLFKFEVIALGINNILPFRIGELSKVFLVSRKYDISKTLVLSTVFIERLFDTIMLFLIFIIYSIVGKINIPLITKKTGIAIIILVLIFIYLFFILSANLINKSQKIQKKHHKLYSFIVKLQNGGACFKSIKISFLIIIAGIIQWNFDVLNNYIIAKSLSIKEIDISKAAITVVAGSFSASIPSMPGYFGNYEYAISRVCMFWGIEKELATLFPTVIHVLSYVLITSSAILFFYTDNIKIKNILISKKES